MKLEKYNIFSNGVRTVIAETKSKVSYLCIFINAGSRDENRSNLGAMHFIEHLMFKGTKSKTYFEILNYIESVGGDMNAYTSKEETCLYISIQNKYLERAFEVLSDIFYNSQFTTLEFKKEKEIIIDEINSYKDSPQELILDEFEEMLFFNHELGSNILGDIASLKKMNLEKLENEYKQHYVNSNLIISYVGGVSENKVLSYMEKYFGSQSASSSQHNRKPFVEQVVFSEKKSRKTFQAHCMIGSIAPSMYDDSKTAMVLVNNLLGGTSFNSILNLALREEKGLTYNIESNYTAYSDTGIFTVYFGTNLSKIDECREVINSKFHNIISNGLSNKLLKSYKQQLIGQIAITFDNYNSMAISNAKSFISYDKVDSYEEIKRKILGVSNDEIINLTKNVLNPDTMSMLLYY